MSKGAITLVCCREFDALQDVCFKNGKIPLLGGAGTRFDFHVDVAWKALVRPNPRCTRSPHDVPYV